MAFGWPISFAMPNALRAAGDARFVMVASTISMWVVRVCAAYLFTFTLGIGPLGVWLAMGADFFVRGGAFTLRWRSGKWQEKRVIRD
jgi:Na+-driven multidrug efflux pump